MCAAIPKRRGWAMPWPSRNTRSGRELSCSNTLNRSGASLNVKSPGTYGNVGAPSIVFASTMVISGYFNTTTAAIANLRCMIEMSAPATRRGSLFSPCRTTSLRSRSWICLASLVVTFQEWRYLIFTERIILSAVSPYKRSRESDRALICSSDSDNRLFRRDKTGVGILALELVPHSVESAGEGFVLTSP